MKMKCTLVLGAVPWEIAPVCAALKSAKTGKLYDFPFWTGTIAGSPVVVAITGVGKTNAAMISALFIARFQPQRLIYTGTAARVNRALNTGDIILGRKVVHHDFGTLQRTGMLYRKTIGPVKGRPTNFQYAADSTLLKRAVAAAKTFPPRQVTANGKTYVPAIRPGIICAGDVFGMTEFKLTDIRKKIGADLVEMEGSAVGQVCTELHLPFLVIRGGSNFAQENPGGDYKRLGNIAARSAALFTVHLLGHLTGKKK
jgi:5'-methylthioadenosine/S-adenosylhomocysteine nucleosidase